MSTTLCSFFPPSALWDHWNTTTLPLPNTSYCVMESNLSSRSILQACTGSAPIAIPFDNDSTQGTGCYIYSAVRPKEGKVVQRLAEARNCIREALVTDRFGNMTTSDWVECRQVGQDGMSGGEKLGMGKMILLVIGLGLVGAVAGMV